MANVDVRVGTSAEVKNELIPSIEHSHFLGYDEEDRIVLYTMAVALATRYKLTPKAATFTGLVRMRSIPDDEMAQLLLMYLANRRDENIEDMIDDIGESRRKDVVQFLNQVANAGFNLVKEKMGQQDDIVIADMFGEMNEAYQCLASEHPELGLPEYKDYSGVELN